MQPGGLEASLMPNQTFHLFYLFQPRIKYGVTCYGFDNAFRARWIAMFIREGLFSILTIFSLSFLWVRLRLTQRLVDYDWGWGDFQWNNKGHWTISIGKKCNDKQSLHHQTEKLSCYYLNKVSTAWFTSLRGPSAPTFWCTQASEHFEYNIHSI